MSPLGNIKKRYKIRSELLRRIDVQKTRIEACLHEICTPTWVRPSRAQCRRIVLKRVHDLHCELVNLEKYSECCSLFWVVTGIHYPKLFT